MVEHPVRAYEEELKALDTKIAQMGGLAEQALGQAIDALYNRDPDLAEVTLENDRAIDALERSVDELAISIIARRAPVASDLRQIITAIRIAADLERIGDLAKNIAKRAIAVAAEPHPKQVMAGFMHIGETAMRLRNVTPRIVKGLRRSISGTFRSWSVPARPAGVVTRKNWSFGCLVMYSFTASFPIFSR